MKGKSQMEGIKVTLQCRQPPALPCPAMLCYAMLYYASPSHHIFHIETKKNLVFNANYFIHSPTLV